MLLLSVFVTPTALAQASVFNADKVTFCSDGEFDWNSGQSLYDFVILSRRDGDFLISFLGIPHPSFEERAFDNAWIKMKGRFSARKVNGDIFQNLDLDYELSLDVEGQPPRIAKLSVDKTGAYTFNVEPALVLEGITEKGLCWDSLSREPDAIRQKSLKRR
ncbi:MAG: hypothetical protein P8P44_08400 [Alphaproteobacteria bacterium]|nr:hypothetical protein [Alphaproteobacteria bacterium]